MEVSQRATRMLKVKCRKDNILTRQGAIFKRSCECAKRGCATTFGGTSEIQVESPLTFIGCGSQQVPPRGWRNLFSNRAWRFLTLGNRFPAVSSICVVFAENPMA
jgi:hypothetical protein